MAIELLSILVAADDVYGTTSIQPAVGKAWRFQEIRNHLRILAVVGDVTWQLQHYIPSKSLLLQNLVSRTSTVHDLYGGSLEIDWAWITNDLIYRIVMTQGDPSNVGAYAMAFSGIQLDT